MIVSFSSPVDAAGKVFAWLCAPGGGTLEILVLLGYESHVHLFLGFFLRKS